MVWENVHKCFEKLYFDAQTDKWLFRVHVRRIRIDAVARMYVEFEWSRCESIELRVYAPPVQLPVFVGLYDSCMGLELEEFPSRKEAVFWVKVISGHFSSLGEYV